MLVAGFGGGGDTSRKDQFGFWRAVLASQELGVHQIARNVIGVALEEGAEVFVSGSGVAAVHAFNSEAVARKSVVRFSGDKFFKELAARFLLSGRLFGHGNVPYYTGARQNLQRGER